MRWKISLASFVWLVVFAGIGLAGADAAEGDISVEAVEFENLRFEVVRIDPAKQKLELMWLGPDGQPLKIFRAAEAALKPAGRRLSLAMNAGIYEPGQVPSGLHIQEGKTLVKLNLNEGSGNFFLKPNGVFFLNADGSAGVMEATAYATAGKAPRIAVQSGPVLVIDGKIHPAFRDGSLNVRLRNGVGVDGDGRIVLATSVMEKGNDVNFHTFARLFRDRLGCPSALFLDGDIGELYVRSRDGDVPQEKNWFAAMLVVTEEIGEGKADCEGK